MENATRIEDVYNYVCPIEIGDIPAIYVTGVWQNYLPSTRFSLIRFERNRSSTWMSRWKLLLKGCEKWVITPISYIPLKSRLEAIYIIY